MKTYVLDSLNRLKSYSKSLDAKAVLCNKAWLIFNAEGKKEVWKFKQDGTMSIALNGEFQIYNWNYDPSDNSVNIMMSNTSGICIKPIVYNEYILGFRQDGTERDMAMIEEGKLVEYAIHSAEELMELEKRILIEAYSQTPEGRAAHALEIENWEANERRKKAEKEEEERQKIEQLKTLSKELIQQFEEGLSSDDRILLKKADFKFVLHRNPMLYVPIAVFVISWILTIFDKAFLHISLMLVLVLCFYFMCYFLSIDHAEEKAKWKLTELYGTFLARQMLPHDEIEKLKKMAWFYTAYNPNKPLG